MASFKSHLFNLSILIALSLSNIEASSPNINTLCNKSSVPDYCQQLLGLVPTAATADMKGLGRITLDLTTAKASNLVGQFKSKPQYKSCADSIGDAISSLKDAGDSLKKGDYGSMNIQASAAMTDVGDCVDQISGGDASILNATNDLEKTISVLLAASNLLK